MEFVDIKPASYVCAVPVSDSYY